MRGRFQYIDGLHGLSPDVREKYHAAAMEICERHLVVMVREMEHLSAENYVAQTFDFKGGIYLVSVTRHDGESPLARIERLQAENDALRKRLGSEES